MSTNSSSPTMPPTPTNTTDSSAGSAGETIGIAVISEIIAGIIAGIGIIFQKLICFKVFDYYAGATGIATDICSCYKKSWQEARNQYQNKNVNQDDSKHSEENDKANTDEEKGEKFADPAKDNSKIDTVLPIDIGSSIVKLPLDRAPSTIEVDQSDVSLTTYSSCDPDKAFVGNNSAMGMVNEKELYMESTI